MKTALVWSNYISPFRYKKTPENLDFPGFLNHFDIVWAVDYRLLNCGARRAALRPYCFLSYGRKPLILLGFLGFRASVNPWVHPFRVLFGVAPFLGANALFTTADNSLGLLYFTLVIFYEISTNRISVNAVHFYLGAFMKKTRKFTLCWPFS